MSAPTLAFLADVECDCPGPEFCGHGFAHRAQIALAGYIALVDGDGPFYIDCPRCGGEGDIVVFPDDAIRCPECNGLGEIEEAERDAYDEGDEADYRYRDMRDRECEEAL